MVKPTNVFNDVVVGIRDELREGDKRAAKSKTPKFGEGDRRKNRKSNEILLGWQSIGVQLQDLKLGAEVEE